MRWLLLAVMMTSLGFQAAAADGREVDVKKLVDSFNAIEEGTPSEPYDSNGDGKADLREKQDEDGNKIMEMIDFNHDGVMDDFYYFTDGIITLRKIDSNFDQKIDVWVYIKEGKYIEKYERDMDYDGNVDQVKVFGEEG